MLGFMNAVSTYISFSVQTALITCRLNTRPLRLACATNFHGRTVLHFAHFPNVVLHLLFNWVCGQVYRPELPGSLAAYHQVAEKRVCRIPLICYVRAHNYLVCSAVMQIWHYSGACIFMSFCMWECRLHGQWQNHRYTADINWKVPIFHCNLFFQGTPDTLICGNCRECFSDFRELLEHKRSYCKLRFTCKCQENASSKFITPAW